MITNHTRQPAAGPASQSATAPKIGVSIVVPAYNEEDAIADVLRQLDGVMARYARQLAQQQPPTLPVAYELVVVDDGSQDRTAQVARQSAAELDSHRIRVLTHHANRGYGAALKTGIRHARYDRICITDADGTYPNERIPDLIAHMQSDAWDMVIGARIGENVFIPPARRPVKWAIAQLANWVAGETVPDINSGLRLFHRQVALDFFELLPDGFSFTTTITLAMLTNGYLLDYIAIDYHPRVGLSKIRPIRDTMNFVQLILRIGLYFAPLKIFLPLSLAMLLLALFWGLFSTFVLEQLADVSTIVIAMTAIQVAVVGLVAELINRRVPGYARPVQKPTQVPDDCAPTQDKDDA